MDLDERTRQLTAALARGASLDRELDTDTVEFADLASFSNNELATIWGHYGTPDSQASSMDAYRIASQILMLTHPKAYRRLDQDLFTALVPVADPLISLWAVASFPDLVDLPAVIVLLERVFPVAYDQSGLSECRVVAYHRILQAFPAVLEATSEAALVNGESHVVNAAAAGDIYVQHGFWCWCDLPRCRTCGQPAQDETSCEDRGCRDGVVNAKAKADIEYPDGYPAEACPGWSHPDPCSGTVTFSIEQRPAEDGTSGGSYLVRTGPWCSGHVTSLLSCELAGEHAVGCSGDGIFRSEAGGGERWVCNPHRVVLNRLAAA